MMEERRETQPVEQEATQPVEQDVALFVARDDARDSDATSSEECAVVKDESPAPGGNQDTHLASEEYRREKKKTIRRGVMWAFIFMLGVFVLSSLVPNPKALSIPSDARTALVAIIIIVVGCLVGRKDMEPGWVKGSGKKMTVRVFFILLGVFALARFIGMGCGVLAALPIQLLNLDMSSLEGMMGQKEGAEHVVYVIWMGFITPFVEEFAFRGLVMQRFKKYGFLFAVIASTILFALYHSNPIQLFSTFFMGLLLGYVALRYSILWSIVLHVINNGILVNLLGPALHESGIPVVSAMGDNVLLVIFLVIGAVLLIGRHPIADTKAFFAQAPTEKGSYPLVFTNAWFVGMVLVFVAYTGMIVFGIGMMAG